jgi:hypothetical protein
MSQQNNDYLFEILGTQGFTSGEDIMLFAGAPTSQQGAYPIKGQMHRIVACSVANASLVLKSVLSNDNPQLVFLINDSPNTLVVFPFKSFAAGSPPDVGESVNGVVNGSFSLTSLNAAIFVSSLVQSKRKGGSSGITPALNWSAALLT